MTTTSTTSTPTTHVAPTTARTALVTGASRGIGRAIAASLVADGWTVVVDARHREDLAEAVAGWPDTPGHAIPLPGDITEGGHRRELAEVAAVLGGLDLVVLNAATLGPTPLPPVAELDLHDLRAALETNVVSQLALVQAVLAHLRPGATVASLSSDAALEAYPGWGAYGASKAAVDHLLAVLGAERPDLHVRRVDPGDVRTDMHQAAFPGEDISDRPPPEAVVPQVRAQLEGVPT